MDNKLSMKIIGENYWKLFVLFHQDLLNVFKPTNEKTLINLENLT